MLKAFEKDLETIPALLRAADALKRNADKAEIANVGYPDLYVRAFLDSMMKDANRLRDLAQHICDHPDEEYFSADQDDDGVARCSLCEKVWPYGKGRDDG